MRQVVGLVLRTGLWAFAFLVGALTGASFVKSAGALGSGSGSTGLLVVVAGFVLAGFVVACVVSAMETVFPVFRASWGRRSELT
ncbi:MAG TPA: hypothetical protein VIB48_10855 [Acidimicrobiia bacterium]